MPPHTSSGGASGVWGGIIVTGIEKSLKMKREFLVRGFVGVRVEFDDCLLPDDEWRSVFYPIHTLEDLAKHMAWNLGINNARLSDLDGFADRPDSDACSYGLDIEWDEAEELIR